MGLSNAISGGIMIFAALAVLAAIYPLIEATSSMAVSSSRISDVENSISKTNISVNSLTANNGSNTVLVNITNTGNAKLWKYNQFNVIITYDWCQSLLPLPNCQSLLPLTKIRSTETLSYTPNCGVLPPTDNWCIKQFMNDLQDPGILNSGESMQIQCVLQNHLWPNGLLIVTVSTDNGVVASRSMVVR